MTDDTTAPSETDPETATADLEARARAWIAADPDPATRARLEAVLARGDRDELADHVGRSLSFGTAGLRGEVGAGPNRMNRAVVVRASRGLADHLLARVAGAAQRGVVVGFDARPDSRRFAADAAAVLRAAGLRVWRFDEPVPTPLVAFAARHLDTAGAVVVTASHNPPADNGYKVYDEHGVQITPPTDRRIAAAIEAVGPAAEVPGVGSDDTGEPLPDDLVDAYLAALAAARPEVDGDRGIPLVLTPLHGVGGAYVERALTQAGFTDLYRVEQQWQPDGTFPTVRFPNPEEPGALDLAMARADAVGAVAVLANDPDTDRLAVAVPDGGDWRRLTGDEVGALLADHLLAHGDAARPLVVSSIVSSARLGRVAARHGARHETTLTGFKWIWRAGRELAADGWDFVLGYEEALGYSVGPVVRDKDGIGAAVVMAEVLAQLAGANRTLLDRLAALDDATGRWVNVQASVRRTGVDGAAAIRAAADRAAEAAPSTLAGRSVARVEDLRSGADRRPAWLPADLVVIWHLDGDGRVLVRPSGTEPKLKVYVDLPLAAGESEEVADEVAAAAVAALGLD